MKFPTMLAALSMGVAMAQGQLPVDKEIALGKSMARDIERRTPALRDLAVHAYVNALTKNIARGANLPYAVTAKVLDTQTAGATAAPGFVFITAGMLARSGSAQELSAVIAHEIAHMAAHQISGVAASNPRVFLGGSGGLCAKYPFAAATPVPVAFQGRANNREAEADRLAFGYASAGGSSAQFAAMQDHLAAIYAHRAASPNPQH
jgi:predicted Zn-dependent protease